MAECKRCSNCCRYIATEIDKPEKKEDYDEIVWFLLHENVHVYIDDEDDWIVEFSTKCRALDDDGKCKVHEKKPELCKKYDPAECTNGGESGEKVSFWSVEDFKKYCNKLDLPFTIDFPEGY